MLGAQVHPWSGKYDPTCCTVWSKKKKVSFKSLHGLIGHFVQGLPSFSASLSSRGSDPAHHFGSCHQSQVRTSCHRLGHTEPSFCQQMLSQFLPIPNLQAQAPLFHLSDLALIPSRLIFDSKIPEDGALILHIVSPLSSNIVTDKQVLNITTNRIK